MISIHFQGKSFNIIVIQVYASTTDAEEAKVDQIYEDVFHLLEITKHRCPFHHRGLEWVNLTQMTIISTTAGRNPLAEME